MSKVLVTESNLQDIAYAIRSKSESPDIYRPGDMAAAIMAIPTGSATLVSKTITQNGEYDPEDDDADGYSAVTVNVPNSYAAADEGKVVSSGALVAQSSTTVTQNGTYDTTENNEVVVAVQPNLQSKTATENGTVTPDSGYDGLSSVVVNVSGGGGGGVILMTRAAWDALTTAEKKTYGLVAIQDAITGYLRGILVNGADFSYLPGSNSADIKCIATWGNFNPNSLSWGEGDVPVVMAAACTQYQSEEAVHLNALTGSNSIGIELESITSDFTVYVVAKGLAYASGDVIVLGSVNAWNNNRLVMLYHRSGSTWISSIYGSDVALIDTQNDYVVIAIRSSNMSASWFAYGVSPRTNVAYTSHGTRFTFGSRGTTYSTDLAVKFIGYVAGADSDIAVNTNLEYLANTFLS